MTPNEREIQKLQEEAEFASTKLRLAKREASIENLKENMKYIDSKDLNEQYKLYRACIDYCAQHRIIHQRHRSTFMTSKELKRRDKQK